MLEPEGLTLTEGAMLKPEGLTLMEGAMLEPETGRLGEKRFKSSFYFLIVLL